MVNEPSGASGASKKLKVAEKKFNSRVKKRFGDYRLFADHTDHTDHRMIDFTILHLRLKI